MSKETDLIKEAHYNLTWKVGKRDYAPTMKEIELEIGLILEARKRAIAEKYHKEEEL